MLSRRRGHITADVPQPGTPAYIVKVSILVLLEVTTWAVGWVTSQMGLGKNSKDLKSC